MHIALTKVAALSEYSDGAVLLFDKLIYFSGFIFTFGLNIDKIR